jgi:hypothetical protein
MCWWQFTFMLKTMQYDFTHCFNHWKMHGWIKREIVLKLFQVTNGSWIEIHQIHEAWNWSLNQKWPKQSLTRNYFNKQEIVFVYDHVEWYVVQHAFLLLLPNLIKSTMLIHRLLFTWKVYSFKVISHFSLSLQYIKVMKKTKWQKFCNLKSQKSLLLQTTPNICSQKLITSNCFLKQKKIYEGIRGDYYVCFLRGYCGEA